MRYLCLLLLFLSLSCLTSCNSNSETLTGGRPNFEYSGNNCVQYKDKLYYEEDVVARFDQTVSADDNYGCGNSIDKYIDKFAYDEIGKIKKTTDSTPENNYESPYSPKGSPIYSFNQDTKESIYLYDLDTKWFYRMTYHSEES